MTSDNSIHVGKPPFFDGNNYNYWKTRMAVHLKAISRKIWIIVNDGSVILDDKILTSRDEENELLNDQANEIWKKLMEIHEGTSSVKEAKMYVLKGKFSEFAMKKDGTFVSYLGTVEKCARDVQPAK
jgi:hypothetical protein